jgi:protein-tyrosine phosphatase
MPGRIDTHCHLLPAIDDGCISATQAAMSVERLIEVGFTTSVCTPHIWPEMFPGNTPAHIAEWTAALSAFLDEQNIDYELIPGGEVRLFKKAIDWFQTHGVPTLGDSNLVLLDSWDSRFPKHAHKTIDWLLAEGYQPVLAHPERMQIGQKLDDLLDGLASRGVLFQGNFLPFTGLDLPCSDTLAWRFLEEGRYAWLALDLHRPDSLEDRLLGVRLVEERLGREKLDELINDAPRRIIFGEGEGAG